MNVESKEFRVEEMHRLPQLVPSLCHGYLLPENVLEDMPPATAAPAIAHPAGT